MPVAYSPEISNHISRWCLSRQKRWLDATAAAVGLTLLSPAFVVIASAIVMSSGRPIIFRQHRVGRSEHEFELLKFRTMTMAGSEDASGLTQLGNSRVTPLGRLLRKWKLDELPQLLNVLRGDMTLVGPRPDMKHFWARASAADRQILSLTPGITGAASIAFHDEEDLLAQVSTELLPAIYVEQILPIKARIDIEYAARATFWTDCVIVLETVFMPFLRYRNENNDNYAQISRE
jgi:lipopolysaccharide/colanic/teichoic acid biosynthesis glycosyltransferase